MIGPGEFSTVDVIRAKRDREQLTDEQIDWVVAAYAPQLVTLVVLAVASQRLRPPATAGEEYRRGEGD